MRNSRRAYKLNKTLVPIGAITTHEVEEFANGTTKLYGLFFDGTVNCFSVRADTPW